MGFRWRMESVEIEYTQTNHVIISQINERQCLSDTLNALGFGNYRPKTYSALTQKFSNPKSSAIIFSTGVITSMGCPSFYEALYVLLKIKRELGVNFVNIRLSNIVVTFSIKSLGVLNLEKFQSVNQSSSTLNMEIFPCLTFIIPDTNIKANIFATGKVVLTGCGNHSQISNAITITVNKVLEVL